MSGLIIHEWIEKFGGAERVLDSFANLYPDADIYCLWNDAPGRYADSRVHESPLAKTKLRKAKALALPLMPTIWNSTRPETKHYDWALISSYVFAHQARVPHVHPENTFIYTHTPARFLWAPEFDQRGQSALIKAAAPYFRSLDRRRAQKHHHVAANSEFVKARIAESWGIEATVIHPPAEVEHLQSVADWRTQLTEQEAALFDAIPPGYLLGASRFVAYKNLEAVIDAGAASKRPVIIAGSGPHEAQLRGHANTSSAHVTFINAPGNNLMAALMQHAAAFIFPPIEDFGIMPVEAMALGTPVILNRIGGAKESIIEGRTGITLNSFHGPEIADAIDQVTGFSRTDCRTQAQKFSEHEFAANIDQWTNIHTHSPQKQPV